MLRRFGALVAIALGLSLAWFGSSAPEASAAKTCPPVTIETLFPEPVAPPPKTTPTTTPTPSPGDPSTTTTVGESTTTTTPPESTTTTAPETTTTTLSPETTLTTLPDETSTTTTPNGSTTVPDSTPGTTTPSPAPRDCVPFSYAMTWPLAGEGQVISGFGSDRDGGARHHKGNDILAVKLTPVVAVADGEVLKVVQEVGTENCCWLILEHDDGWQSYYIHLNNDRYGTDDGQGYGVRPDLVDGTAVKAGEVIGWVGDSGNAEETVNHLHFELRTPAGDAINPRPSLQAAKNGAELDDPQPHWPFADDDGLPSEWLAASLLTEGLFLPCDASMITVCPDGLASPDLPAVIAEHLIGRTPPQLAGQYRTPANPAGAPGCTAGEECFEAGIPESEIARVAAWAWIQSMVATLLPKEIGLEGEPTVNLPSVADAEVRLRAEGLIGDCSSELDSRQLASREQTVNLLSSWLQGLNPEPCPDPDQRAR